MKIGIEKGVENIPEASLVLSYPVIPVLKTLFIFEQYLCTTTFSSSNNGVVGIQANTFKSCDIASLGDFAVGVHIYIGWSTVENTSRYRIKCICNCYLPVDDFEAGNFRRAATLSFILACALSRMRAYPTFPQLYRIYMISTGRQGQKQKQKQKKKRNERSRSLNNSFRRMDNIDEE